MCPTELKVGEIVILKRKSSDKQIKAFVKEVIIQPTPNHTGVYHSGMYHVHGVGEIFGDEIHRTGETLSEKKFLSMIEAEEEEILTA